MKCLLWRVLKRRSTGVGSSSARQQRPTHEMRRDMPGIFNVDRQTATACLDVLVIIVIAVNEKSWKRMQAVRPAR